jgi:hypothetical protein
MPETRNRRDFVRTLALGASAGALMAPVSIRADDPEKKDDKPKPDAESPKSEAAARMELVLARFGKQLDDEARKAVRKEIDAIVKRAELLRKIQLDNGEGPFPIFTPYRAPLA